MKTRVTARFPGLVDDTIRVGSKREGEAVEIVDVLE